MIKFQFTIKAKKEFDNLDHKAQKRVIKKLKELKTHPNIKSILKPIVKIKYISHRMRIGNIRLLLMVQSENKFIIKKIGYRQNFYN